MDETDTRHAGDHDPAQPRYTIGAVSANGESFLNVTKTWGKDDYERLVIPQPNWDFARDNAQLATEMLEEEWVQDAMQLVEMAGVAGGVIDPQRDDPRLFTQGPPDPFRTIRQAELERRNGLPANRVREQQEFTALPDSEPIVLRDELDTEEAPVVAPENDTAWFEDNFDQDSLLESLDSTVNYAVVVQFSDPSTLELTVEKVWKAEHGAVGRTSQTIQTYDPDDEHQAQADRDALLDVYDERGLEAMMRQAELQAMRNGHLDPLRDDLRMFPDGPPDRFETLAQRLADELNPYWNTEGEQIEEPEARMKAENPYWRLDTLPVDDPEDNALGHALHIVVYPGVEYDPEQIGAPPFAEDEPFRMLEMAHFETIEAADKFGKEFNGYLMPGLLEAPELAEEVARLEEMPVEWKTLEGDDLKAYQNGELTLTRELSDWHPYNPNAERDAQIEAEGLYTDPIQQVGERDEGKNEPEVGLASQDLNL